MSTVVAEVESLKLTVDDHNIVWYLLNNGLPKSSGTDSSDFLKSIERFRSSHIRSVGSANNADLLKQLFEMRLHDEFDSLEVCGPQCCHDILRKDPELTLYSMRKWTAPVSLGGWHTFSIKDYISYALAAHYEFQTEYTRYVENLVASHPLWPYISFIEDADAEAFSRLVGCIIDPRWFASEDDKETDGLENYLGLVDDYHRSDDLSKEKRYQMVMDSWHGTKTGKSIKIATPRTFLQRIWSEHKGSDYVACKKFIEFFRLAWLMVLCDTGQATQLFVPQHFLSTGIELDAFYTHVKKYLTT